MKSSDFLQKKKWILLYYKIPIKVQLFIRISHLDYWVNVENTIRWFTTYWMYKQIELTVLELQA